MFDGLWQIDWGCGDDNNGIDFCDEIDFGIADITVESGGQETQVSDFGIAYNTVKNEVCFGIADITGECEVGFDITVDR